MSKHLISFFILGFYFTSSFIWMSKLFASIPYPVLNVTIFDRNFIDLEAHHIYYSAIDTHYKFELQIINLTVSNRMLSMLIHVHVKKTTYNIFEVWELI